MARILAGFAACAALAGFLGIPAVFAQECDAGGGEATGDPVVVKQLRVEINALNLINGLHMTVEQVEALLDGARRNKELQATCLGEGAPKATGEAEARARLEALQGIKDALERGEPPGEEALKALKERFGDKPRGPREGFRPDRAFYMRQLRAIEKKIEGMLLDSQKEVISTFKPCLITPKNLKDPVRVGQAADNTREAEVLARLRTLPAGKWEKVKAAVLDLAISKWEEKHGKFTPAEREAEIAEADAVVAEARGLSEVDFQMRKDDLSRRFALRSRKDELKKEMETLEGERFEAPGKVANILLDPKIIPVLERRLRQLKGFAPEDPVDLEGIAGADTCKDGKCGKKFKD